MDPITAVNPFADIAPKEARALRTQALDVARSFESLFAQQMVSGIRESAQLGGGDGMFGSGPGANTYTQWFDTHMSEFLASNGQLGVTDTLMREFERFKQIPTLEQARPEGGTDVLA